MARQRVSKLRLANAIRNAGPDAPPGKVVAYYLAPSLAEALGPFCSTEFLSALHERISIIEQRLRSVTVVPFDAEAIQAADRVFRSASTIGGSVGLVIGAISAACVLEWQGLFIGIFFPGIILCVGFASTFQKLSFRCSATVRRSLAMAYNIHLAAKSRTEYWHSLDWKDFEHHVATIFRELGFTVKLIGGSGDEGIDIIAWRNERKYLIQCKHYSKPVGPNFIREMLGTMTRSPSDVAVIIATSGYSKGAIQTASGAPIILLNLDELLEIRRTGKIEKLLAPSMTTVGRRL